MLTPCFGQLLVIEGDTLHCFNKDEASKLLGVVYDRDECSELLTVCDSAIVEYQGLVGDMQGKISLLDSKFLESERLSQMAVKQYKKEFRRHKLTKVGFVIVSGLLVVVAIQ